MDLKTAFNLVNRDILVKTMRERRLKEGLVRKYEEVVRETVSRVREKGRSFGRKGGLGRDVH